MEKHNFLVGITGNIGSGKSTVVNLLKAKNFNVLSADEQTEFAYILAKQQLIDCFSLEIFNVWGDVDKKKLGEIVFSDSAKREKLNSILHPIIIDLLFNKASALSGIVFIEIPLLFECNIQSKLDVVWLIDTIDNIKLQRIIKRDGLSLERAVARLRTQMQFNELKKQHPHIIIDNSGDLKSLEIAVNVELAKLEKQLEK